MSGLTLLILKNIFWPVTDWLSQESRQKSVHCVDNKINKFKISCLLENVNLWTWRCQTFRHFHPTAMWVIRGFARFTRFLISLLERIGSIFRSSYWSQYFFMHRFRSYVVSYFNCKFLLLILRLFSKTQKYQNANQNSENLHQPFPPLRRTLSQLPSFRKTRYISKSSIQKHQKE